jgi:hypothetical protein
VPCTVNATVVAADGRRDQLDESVARRVENREAVGELDIERVLGER